MITEIVQWKTPSGNWVIIVRWKPRDRYDVGASIWYESDGGPEQWPDMPGRERLARMFVGR